MRRRKTHEMSYWKIMFSFFIKKCVFIYSIINSHKPIVSKFKNFSNRPESKKFLFVSNFYFLN